MPPLRSMITFSPSSISMLYFFVPICSTKAFLISRAIAFSFVPFLIGTVTSFEPPSFQVTRKTISPSEFASSSTEIR